MMLTNPWFVLGATVALIVLSAFFVIIEFSLLGARRYRLEEMAVTSRAARVALRESNELTVVLAGAQLGITVCTFALGAVTKPAVDAWLYPLFASWMPPWGADALAFALALLIVTFLHLVVGEMAPKSWAIAHPERSALLIALPTSAFIWVFRPFLRWLNHAANRLVEASGVQPVDRAGAGGYDRSSLQQLIEHSTHVGKLKPAQQAPLSGAIALGQIKTRDAVDASVALAMVGQEATVAQVQQVAEDTGHLRVLVGSGPDTISGVVHVRDTLTVAADTPARQFARPPFVVDPDATLHQTLTAMQKAGQQLAVVGSGRPLGIITLSDILGQVLPTEQ